MWYVMVQVPTDTDPDVSKDEWKVISTGDKDYVRASGELADAKAKYPFLEFGMVFLPL